MVSREASEQPVNLFIYLFIWAVMSLWRALWSVVHLERVRTHVLKQPSSRHCFKMTFKVVLEHVVGCS